ncbi:class I SAM-dependent methyltransferase [Neorhodopirellula lusitana]|uniref:class I SAM-dependent methyltransferase n=1 Tax=Neorhodopirellula lusitana TaxID=445327 RepID=UPI003850F966
MDQTHAKKIDSMLPSDAVVIDVGGGAAPFFRTNWVIDALSYDESGGLLKEPERAMPVSFSRETWVEFDICDRQPWPFADKQFDFAVCSHVLEDVRDPVWVCSEISRIAKAGYIETPSRVVEQSLGVEHPCYAGYYHHRWLVSVADGQLQFRHKPHLLHVNPEAIVARVGFWKTIDPAHEVLTHYWQDQLDYREVLEFDESKTLQHLCDWASDARKSNNLLTRPTQTFSKRLRRAWYHLRLRLAAR